MMFKTNIYKRQKLIKKKSNKIFHLRRSEKINFLPKAGTKDLEEFRCTDNRIDFSNLKRNI